METVQIPISIILEAMLAKLNLPTPMYETRAIGRGFFYPSASHLQIALPAHSEIGYSALGSEEATSEAARNAIRYMQTNENKVVKDYSYDQVEIQQNIKARLQRRLGRKDQKLAKRTSQLVDTIIASDVLIDKLSGSTCNIKKIASKNRAPACGATCAKQPAMVLDIENVATDLSHHTHEAVNMLQATGAYPLGEDWPGEFSSSDDSDEEEASYWKCEALDYDSDGRPIDYKV